MISCVILKNMYSWVFQSLQIILVLWTCAILTVFAKLTHACFFPIALDTILLPISVESVCCLQGCKSGPYQGVNCRGGNVVYFHPLSISYMFLISSFFTGYLPNYFPANFWRGDMPPMFFLSDKGPSLETLDNYSHISVVLKPFWLFLTFSVYIICMQLYVFNWIEIPKLFTWLIPIIIDIIIVIHCNQDSFYSWFHSWHFTSCKVIINVFFIQNI